MNSTVMLALSIGFAVLAFLLTCLCIYSPLKKSLKLLIVIVVSFFYFIGFGALKESQGWAAATTLPERFILLATVIEEPVKDKTKGEIFVWLQPLTDNKPSGEPRAYRFPYEKGLHSLFEEGMKKTRSGNSQMGSTEPVRGPKGTTWLRPAGNDTTKIKMTDLPSPQLPEK